MDASAGLAVRDVAIAFLASVAPTIAALAAWRKGKQNGRAMKEVYVKLDGRLSKYMKISRREARLAGYEEGVRNRHIRKEDHEERARRIRKEDQMRAARSRQLASLRLQPVLKSPDHKRRKKKS